MKLAHITSESFNPALATVLVLATLLSLFTQIQAQAGKDRSSRLVTHPEIVKKLPSQNKRWALLIGVDRYEDSNIGALKGAANDARSLREVLVKYAGFPEDQVVVLSTDEPPERQPTRRNILKRLSNLSGLVPKDGLLLVSFAGHGIERSGEAFLIPSDATLTEDIRLLEETAVSVAQVKQRIKDTGVAQVMILLDACRAYPTGRSDSANPLTESFANAFSFDVRNQEVTAFAVLYATAVGFRAYEYAEKRQGYFSWAIGQALGGAAANERGEVTLLALVKYLEDKVPKLVALDYGPKVSQKPFAEIEGYRADELVLALSSNTGKLTNAGSVPESAETRGNSDTALWDSIKDSKNPEDLSRYLQKYPTGLFVEVAKYRLEQSKLVVSPAKDSATARRYAISLGPKAGKILLSRGYLRREGQKTDPFVNDEHEFLTPLIQALQQANVSVTMEWSLDEKSRNQISGAVREIKKGRKARAGSAPFVVDLEVVFSVKDLPPYDNMKIAVANITLRVLNLDTGEIVAIENLEGRGFGNEQAQAQSNALKEAGQRIPREFINQVAESSGIVKLDTNLGSGTKP